MPRYGRRHDAHLATGFARDEPGGPMWARDVMKYRQQADDADGRETSLTGRQADDVYAPHGHLREAGSRIVLADPGVHDAARSQADPIRVVFT